MICTTAASQSGGKLPGPDRHEKQRGIRALLSATSNLKQSRIPAICLSADESSSSCRILDGGLDALGRTIVLALVHAGRVCMIVPSEIQHRLNGRRRVPNCRRDPSQSERDRRTVGRADSLVAMFFWLGIILSHVWIGRVEMTTRLWLFGLSASLRLASTVQYNTLPTHAEAIIPRDLHDASLRKHVQRGDSRACDGHVMSAGSALERC